MDMLQDILGGGQREQYDDFVRRYDQGAPWDGIGDDEAAERYQQVAPRLSREQYQESAAEAFSRLSPDQRAEFGRWLATRSQERGMAFDDNADYTDPGRLAQYTTRVRDEQPDLMGQLLGGMTGGGSQAGFLSSPIAKAAMGGIAAIAMQKMMGGR